jgi:hypothetical protein
MTEIGIGVLFAVWFVMAYLIIAKLIGPRKQQMAIWRHWTNSTFDAAQLSAGKKPQLFLTTEALSQHHAQAGNRKATGGKPSASDNDLR